MDGPSKLKRLNLEDCFGNKAAVKEILNSCYILQKLALQGQRCDFHFVKELVLRNCKTLQTISLTLCDWLKADSKVDFFGHCLELTEFKMSGYPDFEMQSDQLDLMIDSFPPNLLKIELAFIENLSDLHIEKLVRKCNKITAISLRSTNVTNQSVTTIVKNLKNSLEMLDLQKCVNVNLDNIFEAVRNLTQLNILYYDVHTGTEDRCMKSAKPPKICGTCESLKKERPGLNIYFLHGNKIANVDNYND